MPGTPAIGDPAGRQRTFRVTPGAQAAFARPARHCGPQATSVDAARALLRTWQRIDTTLVPVIGHGGVRALYQRGLQLTVPSHPWLAAADAVGPAPGDAAAWRLLFASQDAAEAASACATLLLAADRLLAGLVGPALAQRLLEPVWRGELLAPLPAAGAVP